MYEDTKTSTGKHGSLVFTEYVLFFVFTIALILCTSKAVFGVQLSNTSLKHVPLILFLAAIFLHLSGRFINGSIPLNSKGIVYWIWPFFILGIYATVGSLIANYFFHLKENFLTFGIYLLISPLFFIWGRERDGVIKYIRPLTLIWAAVTLFSVLGAIARFGKVESLHEIEFLVLPIFIYIYFVNRSSAMKFVAVVLLAIVSILVQKLTGYIIGLAAVIYIFIQYVRSAVSPKWKGLIFTLTLVLLLMFISLLVIGFIFFRDYFPTGNSDVRLHQYEIAYQAFLDSPIWGKAYTASSGEVFRENSRGLNIPTHSDVLDLLKQGGIVAFMLWGIGVFRAIKLFMQSTKADNLSMSAFYHAITFMSIATVFAYTFNPLLLKPPFAFVIWGMLSFSIGLATTGKKES